MKIKTSLRILVITVVAFILGTLLISASKVIANDMWVTAYYGGWMQGGLSWEGHMSADKIDYSAVTHIIHFVILPKRDGSIDYTKSSITPENSAALISRVRQAGKKVLIALGGWDSESAFLDATSNANRQKFINNLVNFMVSRGYDGIDIDWEPISASSVSRIITFITELRTAMDKINPRPLLTAAVFWEPGLFSQLQDKFDQINIMTYDLAGLWMESTWLNAPIYDSGYWFPTTGAAPSANGLVDSFISAGIKEEKLGIGIGFYGYVWKGGRRVVAGGVTAPGQQWTSAPSLNPYVNYYEIMESFYHPAYYRYDNATGSSYLSIEKTGFAENMFISYNDETTCFEKVKYVRNKGLGGIMIFELGGGWRPKAPIPDILLQSVKDAVIQTQHSRNTIPLSPNPIFPFNRATGINVSTTLKWTPSIGANSYALQVSRNQSFTKIVRRSDVIATSLNLDRLNNNKTYYWRVMAKNAYGSSRWSNIWSFTTTTAAANTVIANFKGSPVSNGVLLTWETTFENNNKGFGIERKLSNSNTWGKMGYIAGAGKSPVISNYSYTDTSARKNRTYNYRLKQINMDGSFTYSPVIKTKKKSKKTF